MYVKTQEWMPLTDAELGLLPQEYVELRKRFRSRSRFCTIVGKGNIEAFIRDLRNMEGYQTSQIAYHQSRLDVLKLPKAVMNREADYAVQHETLTMGLRGEQSVTELDTPYTNYGHTTFRRCGNCKHVSSWGAKVRCGPLSLLDTYEGVPYGSPCLLRSMKRTELEPYLQAGTSKVEELKQKREIYREHIRLLLPLKEGAPEKPVFPDYRNYKSFKFGDRVYVCALKPEFRSCKGKLVPGTVLGSLRSDRDIAVRLDVPCIAPHRDQPYRIREDWAPFVWSGSFRMPILIHESELKWLAEPAFRAAWLANARDRTRGNDGWGFWNETTRKHEKLDMGALERAICSGKVARRKRSHGKRMMGAWEAASVLGFPFIPESEDQVVEAYRNLARTDVPKERLQQAKSTLLVRIQGLNAID